MKATLGKFTYQDGVYQLPGQVLILLPCAWEDVSESEQQLLAKILSSVKLSLAAVQIVHAAKFSAADASVFQAKMILSFGVPFDGLGRLYEATGDGEMTVVGADPIGALDDQRKKNLWGALRQAFKL
jgi:hypothetical protein